MLPSRVSVIRSVLSTASIVKSLSRFLRLPSDAFSMHVSLSTIIHSERVLAAAAEEGEGEGEGSPISPMGVAADDVGGSAVVIVLLYPLQQVAAHLAVFSACERNHSFTPSLPHSLTRSCILTTPSNYFWRRRPHRP